MKRRQFVSLAGSAGVAAASAPLLSFASTGTRAMNSSKKSRVSYVGFFHETNTYLTDGMGETTLDRMRVFRGDQIKTQIKGTAIGGAEAWSEHKADIPEGVSPCLFRDSKRRSSVSVSAKMDHGFAYRQADS